MMTGHELREIRKAARLTQAELAGWLYYGRQAISDMERGADEIPWNVEAMARHLAESPARTLAKWRKWRGLAKEPAQKEAEGESPRL